MTEEAGAEQARARVNGPSAALERLADACGVTVTYQSWNGEERRSSAAAIRAALAAMGISSGDDAACQRELDRLSAERTLRTVPPVVVTRAGRDGEVPVKAPRGAPVTATFVLESGERRPVQTRPGPEASPGAGGRFLEQTSCLLPPDLPLGYHSLEVHVGAAPLPAITAVIVVPERLEIPVSVRAPRPWGLMAQLYSVRSRASWGTGDLVDLRDLCVLGARKAGADFVLVNPLHAAEPVTPLTASPYLPRSRRFVNPLYIRVEEIPEAGYLDSAGRSLIEWLGEGPRAACLNRLHLDRDTFWTAKISALDEVFKVPLTAARQVAFDAFCAEQGEGLTDFATWCTLVEARAIENIDALWPATLASPHGSGVPPFRAAHADRVRFWTWLQWVADEQRAAAQDAARRAGMRIGVMTDLAVGVHPWGADAWALADVLCRGIGVGAPPDLYNQKGQDWSQPPWQPRALEEAGYVPFRDVVRAALRHAGAVRVDHILGLFRLWWVPEGHTPDDGVYVRYDHEALIGILVLEAARAGAIVIGEDLGTVEPWVAEYLAERGVLGTTVFWFEKRADGTPRLPDDYRPGILATVTVHDLPPTAAYLAGDHVKLREGLGLLARTVDDVQAEADAERASAVAMLAERGWLAPDATADNDAILVAVHRAVFASPCALVGVALTDLVGDVRTQNQPGTDKEHPNWKFPLCDGHGAPVLLDALFDHPRATALIAAIHAGS